jgi:hypothetical protein
MLEGFTCGGLTTGTLLSDQITGNTVSCNNGGGSGGAENMGFYFLGEVASSGLRTRLSSFPGVVSQAEYMHTGAALLVSGSNFTTTSASLTAITGLSWTAPQGQTANVSWDCHVLYSVSGNSNVAFGYQTTPAPANSTGWGTMYLNTGTGVSPTVGTAVIGNTGTGSNGIVGPATPTATATTVLQADLHGGLEAPYTAPPPTLNIMASIASGNTLTIYRDGTSCHVNF